MDLSSCQMEVVAHEHEQPEPPLSITGVDKLNIGFTPVDIRGRPLLNLSNTGGWRAAFFIFGNETANNMVSSGFYGCMIFYLYYEMHVNLPKASNTVNDWVGATGLIPLLSGFIADAYLGRYYTICIFSVVYLVGLVLLTLTAVIASLRPSSSGCGAAALYLGTCTSASTRQMAVFYLAFYTIALRSGGIKPLISTFGADQFDLENPKEKLQLTHFFNWYYVSFGSGALISCTLAVFLYTSVSWAWALGSLTIAMALANIVFLFGTPLYRHHLPSGSPLTRLLQVLVASIRKWRVPVPDDESMLYEVHDKESAIVGSRKLRHVNDLRYVQNLVAWKTNTAENPNATVPFSVWWLMISLSLSGAGETATTIGQLDLFYQEIPDGMRSLGASFVAVSNGLGAFLGSLLLTMTNKITSRNGNIPWVDHIISVGHAAYYFWLLTVLCGIDFIAFLFFAYIYKYKIDVKSQMRGSLITTLAGTQAKNNNNNKMGLNLVDQSEPTGP